MKCFPCLISDDSSKKIITNLSSPPKISNSIKPTLYQNNDKNDLITKILMNNKNIYSPKYGNQMNIPNSLLIPSPTINQQISNGFSKHASEVSETSKRYTSSYRKQMVNTLRQIPKRELIDDNIFNNYDCHLNINMINKNNLTNLMINTYKNNEKLNKTKNLKKNINININFIVKYNKYLSYTSDNLTYNTLSQTSSPKNKKSKFHKKFRTINCHSQTPKKYDVYRKKKLNLIYSPNSRVNNSKTQTINLKIKNHSLNKNFSSEFSEKPKTKIFPYRVQSPKYIDLYKNKILSPKNKKSNYKAYSSSLFNLNNYPSKKINPFLSHEEIIVRTHRSIFGDFENQSKFLNYDSSNISNSYKIECFKLENKGNKYNKINIKLKNSINNCNVKKIPFNKKNTRNENNNILKNTEKLKIKNVNKLKKDKNLLSLTCKCNSKGEKNRNVSLKNKKYIRNIIIK